MSPAPHCKAAQRCRCLYRLGDTQYVCVYNNTLDPANWRGCRLYDRGIGVRHQTGARDSSETNVFWGLSSCSLVEVDIQSSETSSNLYLTIRRHTYCLRLWWSQMEQDTCLFSAVSSPALLCIQCVQEVIFLGGKVTTHLHLMVTLRMRGAIPALPHAFWRLMLI